MLQQYNAIFNPHKTFILGGVNLDLALIII